MPYAKTLHTKPLITNLLTRAHAEQHRKYPREERFRKGRGNLGRSTRGDTDNHCISKMTMLALLRRVALRLRTEKLYDQLRFS